MFTDGRGGGAERHEWLPRLFQGLYVWCHAWPARVDTCLVQLACGLGLVFSMLCRSNLIGVQLQSRSFITNAVQAWVRFLAIHSQSPARDSAIVMMNLAQLDSTIPSSLRNHCSITH